MAKPAHTRVTFEGVVGTAAAPLERWSLNVNFPADAEPLTGTQLVSDSVAEDAAGAWVASFQNDMPSDVVLTQVKVAHVNADGHVGLRADGSYAQGVWTGELAGEQPPQAMPLQTALCVSLVTARSGPTGKGRFFLPWPGYSVSTSTKILSEANATSAATLAVAFLNSLATSLTFPPQVVSSKGYMSQVVGVRVGRVPDTMRSRREDLPEGYVSLPLA